MSNIMTMKGILFSQGWTGHRASPLAEIPCLAPVYSPYALLEHATFMLTLHPGFGRVAIQT